jgi:hypothetical protein
MEDRISAATLNFLGALAGLAMYSAVVWAMIWLASPLFHWPAINLFEVFGTLGLLQMVRDGIVKFKRMMFGI